MGRAVESCCYPPPPLLAIRVTGKGSAIRRALGDRANQSPRGKRRDLPPITIENSGKTRLAAELTQLHPQASLFSGYNFAPATMGRRLGPARAGSALGLCLGF